MAKNSMQGNDTSAPALVVHHLRQGQGLIMRMMMKLMIVIMNVDDEDDDGADDDDDNDDGDDLPDDNHQFGLMTLCIADAC